ncbi:MAG: heme-copper oxidase subunit III [Chitinophagaceae bacterium]
MTAPVSSQRKKIHPHKFTLWVAIASIIMMFAGLTSAYIVKGSLPGWVNIVIPKLFYYSTVIMLASSVVLHMTVKAFRERNMRQYRRLITVVTFLGIVFIVMQLIAFKQMYQDGVRMEGSGPGQFLYIIFGLHALHVIGGIIVLIVLFLKAFNSKIRSYNPIPIEVAATYWHFVDVLWIYLFVFFLFKV